MHRTTPIERLQALLISQIDPLRRPLIVEQMRAAAQIKVMAGLDDDDDEALAAWLGVTLKALSTTG
jgi:hypothetical protein